MRVQALSLASLTERLLNIPEHNAPMQRFRPVAGALELKCARLTLNLAVVNEDDELETAVADIEYSALAVQSMIKEIAADQRTTSAISVSENDVYKWLRENTQRLHQEANTLGVILTSKIGSRT